MENFSNSRDQYWNQIKVELLDESKVEQILFRFLEIGQTLSHGYSITQRAINPTQLIQRVWNAEFDRNRFDKGIFNLDRLAISENIIELSPIELRTIKKLLNEDFQLSNWSGIVLDGLFCQLETTKLKFDWNCNEEINEPTLRFIELLRAKIN